MSAWVNDVARVLGDGQRAVIVTIAHAVGSTPREAGATMIVGENGFDGSIGGGHLEFEALRIARDALTNPSTPTSTWIVRFPLAAKLGQCCGGVATLAFTKMTAGPHVWLDTAMTCVRASTPFALVTCVGGPQDAPSRLLVTMNEAQGSLADSTLETSAVAMARAQLAAGQRGAGLVSPPAGSVATMLIDIVRPDLFPVLIFGNGHVGRALVQVLGVLPACVRWVDIREVDFPPDVPANTDIVITDAPEDEIRHAPSGAFIVVMTHSHPLDFALVETALKRDDWRYLGVIGSKAKRAQLERSLIARGMPASSFARVVCPIGARGGIGIRGKEPGAIAIAVAAEILAAREAAAQSADSARHVFQSKHRV